MSRRRKYLPKTFESTNENRKKSEAFASIYSSMMTSEAFISLTARQKTLYLYCKLQYYAESPRGEPEFTMNQGKWCGKYQLYAKGNAQAFYKDMEALINHGFVDCIYQGGAMHRKNRYKLSDRWRLYGTDKFEVPCSVMTAGMLRKFRKNK